MFSRLPRLVALSLSFLVQSDAASVSLVSIQALAAAAEEANSGIEGGEASPAEVLDTVESSADEEENTRDQSLKEDSKGLSTKNKGEYADEDADGEVQGKGKPDERDEERQASGTRPRPVQPKDDKSKIEPATRQQSVKSTANKADTKLTSSMKQQPAHPTANEAAPVPESATRQQPVKPATDITHLVHADKPAADIATLAKTDPILALAIQKDTSKVAPVPSLAAQAHEDSTPPAPQAQSQSVQPEKQQEEQPESEAGAKSVQPEDQPSGKSSALAQTEVPDVVPSDVDMVSFLAASENQERMALAAEGVAESAEAALATSSARLLKTKALVDELRKSASAKGQDADKDERVQMSSIRVHSAERELSATAARAEQAMSVAKQARLATTQLYSKVLPNAALIETTHLIQTYGPQSCISTWRDSQTGKCFLKTDCTQVTSFNEYDIGFLCENEGQESAEHRFGAGSFAAQEIQQTSISCDQCKPLQDEPVVREQSDVSTRASQTLLRGASAAPLN